MSQAELHEFLDDEPAQARAPRAPDLDQLAMHGAAPEPSHVDPTAAAVAQAEVETHAAPTASLAEMHEILDDEAPGTGTVQQAIPAHADAGAGAHADLPASPGAALAGAAAGITAATDAAPAGHGAAALGAHNVMGGAGGGGGPAIEAAAPLASPEAAPAAPAATPEAAPAEPPSSSSWERGARAYNKRHGHTPAFNAATGDACGTSEDADPRLVAAWQREHGVHHDGRIGPVTLHAATTAARVRAPGGDHAGAEHDADNGAANHPTTAPDLAAPPKPEIAPAKHDEPHAEAPPAPPAPHVEAPVKPRVEAAKPAPEKPKAPAPVVAKPQPTLAPVELAPPPEGAADRFIGSSVAHGKEKDRWAAYGKGDKQTHGWDLGGSHEVKHSGGEASAAIYAVSHVEGRYDSVQTYDAGILSFGIMQWTLHAGSLQKFLGFLKDKSGPEGRAAFQDDFLAHGIDVKPAGGQYQLWYAGKEYPLASDGEGKAAIDKLVREDKAAARKWAEAFHAAGADPRVQKAQFERAKEMYQETQGITFGSKIVEQSLKACKNTFHAKYREQYGKAEGWMTASPKAAALFFSMRVNNPKYANAAFLKAIDAFFDAHGTDRARWPKNWGDAFGDLVAEKSKETLSTWGAEGGGEGRVDKTLRFWNKVHGQPGAAPSTTSAPAAPAAPTGKEAKPSPVAAVAKADAGHAAPDAQSGKQPDGARQAALQIQYAVLLAQFSAGKLDQAGVVKAFIAHDRALHGGSSTLECMMLLPSLLADLLKLTLARVAKPTAPPAPTPPPVTAKTPAVTTKPAVAPVIAPPATAKAKPAPLAAPGAGPAIEKVYKLDKLPTVHAYVPPGGAKGPVEVLLFLHGMFAHHEKDPNPEKSMHLAKAMAQTGRNLVTLAPAADLVNEWPMWSKLAKEHGYVTLIQSSLEHLQKDLNATPAISAGSVSIAGHSAGGSALGEAAEQLGDAVHDITMQDGGYGGKNFLPSHTKLVGWLLSGETDKTLRVIVRGNVATQAEGNVLKSHLNVAALKKAAAEQKHPEVSVTEHAGNHDPRSVKGMYLHHSLHIDGLKGVRQVLVFNMPDANHWDVRNNTTDHLIVEGQDTEFAGAPAVAKPAPTAPAPKAPAPTGPSTAPTETRAKDPAKPEAPHPQVEAAKKLADPATAPTDGKAFHDGGKDAELGAGDEVFEQVNGKDHIAPVFPATPDGMVMAALYELHRGDKRSMAEIMADHTAARWQQGKDVAVEQTAKGDWKNGVGLNDDGDATKHGQVVGHVHKNKKQKGQLVTIESPIGPIQAYKTAAGMGTFSQGKDPMWCGAFVTYCLARCGIDVGSLKYVPSIAGMIAAANGQLFSFETTMTDDGGGDRHKAKYQYGGAYSEGEAGEKKLTKKKLSSAEGIDIRPGDIFYSAKHTGIIAGVNKTPTQIVIRTIEGNSGDAVVSNTRIIEVDKNGRVNKAPFAGWGRPSEFGEFAPPENQSWIESGKGKKHNDEGKTT